MEGKRSSLDIDMGSDSSSGTELSVESGKGIDAEAACHIESKD